MGWQASNLEPSRLLQGAKMQKPIDGTVLKATGNRRQ
jgi:hypothetical protein